jgi:hypothetical protein
MNQLRPTIIPTGALEIDIVSRAKIGPNGTLILDTEALFHLTGIHRTSLFKGAACCSALGVRLIG